MSVGVQLETGPHAAHTERRMALFLFSTKASHRLGFQASRDRLKMRPLLKLMEERNTRR